MRGKTVAIKKLHAQDMDPATLEEFRKEVEIMTYANDGLGRPSTSANPHMYTNGARVALTIAFSTQVISDTPTLSCLWAPAPSRVILPS